MEGNDGCDRSTVTATGNEKRMAKYIRIGQPANDAEKTGLRMLREQLPAHYQILGNFNLRLPQRRNSLEYDAVVIGEYGFYAVEIKGWTGDIKGGDRNWLVPWGRMSNPLSYLETKTKALAHYINDQVINDQVGRDCQDCFYKPVLFFPKEGARLELPQAMRTNVVKPPQLYEHFVDLDMVRERGPGPFRREETRQAIIDAITSIATPSENKVYLTYYEVNENCSQEGRPYKEFLASHQYLRHRSKVRIKAYKMDPLLTSEEMRQWQNRVVRDLAALDALADNPYVARAYDMQPDYGDEAIYYLVSEWVSQMTLADYLAEDPAPSERLRMAGHLVKALASVHEAGVVHRNLHPGSIYITGESEAVPIKIADFDFARIDEEESIADLVNAMGTVGYRAPELALDDADYDQQVDIFSLGAILFEILTGSQLFEEATDLVQIERTWEKRAKEIEDERAREVIGAMISPDGNRRRAGMERAVGTDLAWNWETSGWTPTPSGP